MGMFSIWSSRTKRQEPGLKVRGATIKKTVCCFCSCGCGMDVDVRDGKLIGLEGSKTTPSMRERSAVRELLLRTGTFAFATASISRFRGAHQLDHPTQAFTTQIISSSSRTPNSR